MRKLMTNTFVSLDGVMQAPGGPEEDRSGGFDHGGWLVGYWDELAQQTMRALMARPFELVLGRRTYEIFAAHWPYSDEPLAGPMNRAIKHVASRTLTRLEWENARLIEGDVVEGVRALKAQDGPELQVYGSGNLIRTLLARELIDELQLFVFPLVLGQGKRLFEPTAPPGGLELTGAQVSSTGVFIATYRTGLPIRAGSFAAASPSAAELERRVRHAV